MGNTPLETAEKHRGENAIATVLDQLIQALTIVGARAETEKAAVDTARVDAEVTATPALLRWLSKLQTKQAFSVLGGLSLIYSYVSLEEGLGAYIWPAVEKVDDREQSGRTDDEQQAVSIFFV